MDDGAGDDRFRYPDPDGAGRDTSLFPVDTDRINGSRHMGQTLSGLEIVQMQAAIVGPPRRRSAAGAPQGPGAEVEGGRIAKIAWGGWCW